MRRRNSQISTNERVVDYETREIRKEFVQCDNCAEEVETSGAHPVDAAGVQHAYCTGCFVSEFSHHPKNHSNKTIADIVNDSEESNPVLSTVWEILGAMREAHASYIESMVKGLRGESKSLTPIADGLLQLLIYGALLSLVVSLLVVIVLNLVSFVLVLI